MRASRASLVAVLLFAACGELHIKSVRVGSAVPAGLQGEWLGTWTSTTDQTGGEIILRVQEFAAAPVVTILVNNPCLAPDDYQIALSGTTFELRLGSDVVLFATLGAGRTLDGSYNCAVDGGTLQATWQKDLPAIVDLSGTWQGSMQSGAEAAVPVIVSLHQFVRTGQLLLEGTMELPGVVAGSLPLSGSARFRETWFEVVLTTPSGTQPFVQLTGLGDPEALTIAEGIATASPQVGFPFTQAIWSVTRVQ